MITADFITPPLDDPFLFGQIGAANSLSDIYAMGGRPLTCLNLVGFPASDLGPEILHGIVQGALSKINEAGAVLAGGHTTDDEEPKFGLSVTGIVHPERIWRNSGARPGDVMIMTKPLGSGVLFNANLRGLVSDAALAFCVETITTLNKDAAETLARFEVHAATDITGCGFAGHALEMAKGSDVSLQITTDQVPLMAEALAMYEKGVSTGVNGENRALTSEFIRYDIPLEVWHKEIFVDPQTSGGLLVCVPEAQGDAAVEALRAAGVAAAVQVGRVNERCDEAYLIFS